MAMQLDAIVSQCRFAGLPAERETLYSRHGAKLNQDLRAVPSLTRSTVGEAAHSR
jgi:hypothetical protein